ncbi:hypothetical protein CHRY9390_03034 [Chryseobacterium aquaeductus]|uniref:Uncharacterized protein n=1 Tax=Chryseobacterium aquaeductus TaxID=2675056 RepID=A0A9N8MJI1_9FLAO|nr:hypothetical protein CHRY9390_03034 [Chryseobacterium potabilaquae]CAD7815768.1 hypothetical protein CHRY9390_03034 [Chryseobacterium aquaeductus]
MCGNYWFYENLLTLSHKNKKATDKETVGSQERIISNYFLRIFTVFWNPSASMFSINTLET